MGTYDYTTDSDNGNCYDYTNDSDRDCYDLRLPIVITDTVRQPMATTGTAADYP